MPLAKKMIRHSLSRSSDDVPLGRRSTSKNDLSSDEEEIDQLVAEPPHYSPHLITSPILPVKKSKWKDRIGRIPGVSRKKRSSKGKGRAKEVEDPFMETEADNEEEPEEDDAPRPVTPPAKPVKVYSREVYRQKEGKIAVLLREAYELLKPGSFTSSGLDCTQASLVLAGLLDLSDEERNTVLDLTHAEIVAGFQNMVTQKMKKNRDVEHLKSPEHKRIRRR
jgi:hypothetical protein